MLQRSVNLTINPDINEIPRISQVLHASMQEHGFPEEDILDTQLAVEEAVTNVIMHGYAGMKGEIGFSCRASRGIIEIQIEDSAAPFDPLSLPEPDLDGDIDERKIGGLGIFLIRQVMDEIVYKYENGKNILVLIKRKSG